MERFFYFCCKADEIQVKEFILHRYHSLQILEDLQPLELIKILDYGMQLEKEENLFKMYCGMLPKLMKYISFDEFKNVMTGANVDWRSADVIISEIEEAHKGEIDV